MSRVIVAGMGAVSPGGWGVESLCAAIDSGANIATTRLERPGWDGINVNAVPVASKEITSRFRHPRLRRGSAISRYGVFAALEALENASAIIDRESARIGVVFCTTSGCVTYCRRFYQETLDDPAFASPLLFPETVINAPSSHLSTMIGSSAENYTLVGDSSSVAQAVAMGANWLLSGSLDACLIVGAEEADWLVADAFGHFSSSVPVAEGAGALALTLSDDYAPRLDKITDQHFYSPSTPRESAVKQMTEQLAGFESGPDDLLSAGLTGSAKLDRGESSAWSDWRGERMNVKSILGEGFAAAAMWQIVAALNSLRTGAAKRAIVSLPGAYQFAIGAEFSI